MYISPYVCHVMFPVCTVLGLNLSLSSHPFPHCQDGALGVVWGPVQDSVVYSRPKDIFMPQAPGDLRRQGLFDHVPTIIGMETDAAAEKASG